MMQVLEVKRNLAMRIEKSMTSMWILGMKRRAAWRVVLQGEG